MNKYVGLLSVGLLVLSSSAQAENLQATSCQLYLRKIKATPSSHGSGGMEVLVKVGWLGGGEFIKRVGFYGHTVTEDLGNAPAPACTSGHQGGDTPWGFTEPLEGQGNPGLGEFVFVFPVRTGSVVDACPGFHFSWIGTFFVETDRNTYWVNPDLDPQKYFYFDANGFDILMRKGGWDGIWTDREDMRYYNPLGCSPGN